ncbi:MAG: hypothetical protein AAF518_15015 [Spirochaetota bacterium]
MINKEQVPFLRRYDTNFLAIVLFYYFCNLAIFSKQTTIFPTQGNSYRVTVEENDEGIHSKYFAKDGTLVAKNSVVLSENYIQITDQHQSLFRQRTYNARGLLTKEKYTTIDNKPLNTFPTISYRYNQQGNIIQRSYWNALQKPSQDSDGIFLYQYEYDKNGNLIHESRFGKKKQRREKYSGIHKIIKKYDSRGNLLSEYFYNKKLEPTKDIQGIFKYSYEYDKNGNLVYESYQKGLSKERTTKVYWTYNQDDLLQEKRVENSQGTFLANPFIKNITTQTYQYNADQQLICKRDMDRTGKVILKTIWEYNQSGKLVEKAFFTQEYKAYQQEFVSGHKIQVLEGHSYLSFTDIFSNDIISYRVHKILWQYKKGKIQQILFYQSPKKLTTSGIAKILIKRQGKHFSVYYRKYDNTPITFQGSSRQDFYISNSLQKVIYYTYVPKYRKEYKIKQYQYHYFQKQKNKEELFIYDLEGNIRETYSHRIKYLYNNQKQISQIKLYTTKGKKKQNHSGTHKVYMEYGKQGNMILLEKYSLNNTVLSREQWSYAPTNQINSYEMFSRKHLLTRDRYRYFRLKDTIFRIQYSNSYHILGVKITQID